MMRDPIKMDVVSNKDWKIPSEFRFNSEIHKFLCKRSPEYRMLF